jgi:hypothetical protein
VNTQGEARMTGQGTVGGVGTQAFTATWTGNFQLMAGNLIVCSGTWTTDHSGSGSWTGHD